MRALNRAASLLVLLRAGSRFSTGFHSIVKFNLRQIKFSAGMSLDRQPADPCVTAQGNHTGAQEMDSGDLHRWVWTPDFNWLHKSWSNHMAWVSGTSPIITAEDFCCRGWGKDEPKLCGHHPPLWP